MMRYDETFLPNSRYISDAYLTFNYHFSLQNKETVDSTDILIIPQNINDQ